MMTQAFYTGLSGLKRSSSGIDIISDNLANINTVGYRGNSYEFSSLFEESLVTTSTTSDTIGVGTRLQAAPMMQSSGSYQLTDRSTDLAILGDGWFCVQGDGDPLYTRDGAFTFDSNDDLVTVDGFHVLGTMGGNIDGTVLREQLAEVPLSDVGTQEKLRFPKSLTYPAEPTTQAQFLGNLGTTAEVRTMSASVVDPQGVKNELRLEFSLLDPQTPPGTQWSVKATTQSLDDSIIYSTETGVVEFDESGALLSSTLTSIDNNGARVAIDLSEGFDGVVSISNVDITASSLSNGTIGGELRGYDINKNGEVIAAFTNGMQSSVGRIAVYHFQNDQGLERISGSKFAASVNSGKPLFFQDENGENIIGSDITNFKLEGSNVEMTYGLTELIILQRSYDANSKSITTADEMLKTALDMDA